VNDPEIAVKDKASTVQTSVGSTAILGLGDLRDALSGDDPKDTELP
jgi:hypothetical protein